MLTWYLLANLASHLYFSSIKAMIFLLIKSGYLSLILLLHLLCHHHFTLQDEYTFDHPPWSSISFPNSPSLEVNFYICNSLVGRWYCMQRILSLAIRVSFLKNLPKFVPNLIFQCVCLLLFASGKVNCLLFKVESKSLILLALSYLFLCSGITFPSAC